MVNENFWSQPPVEQPKQASQYIPQGQYIPQNVLPERTTLDQSTYFPSKSFDYKPNSFNVASPPLRTSNTFQDIPQTYTRQQTQPNSYKVATPPLRTSNTFRVASPPLRTSNTFRIASPPSRVSNTFLVPPQAPAAPIVYQPPVQTQNRYLEEVPQFSYQPPQPIRLTEPVRTKTEYVPSNYWFEPNPLKQSTYQDYIPRYTETYVPEPIRYIPIENPIRYIPIERPTEYIPIEKPTEQIPIQSVEPDNDKEEKIAQRAQAIIDDYLTTKIKQNLATKQLIDKKNAQAMIIDNTKKNKVPSAAQLIAKKSMRRVGLGQNFKQSLLNSAKYTKGKQLDIGDEAQMLSMFNTVDYDGNGQIDKNELKILLDSLNKNPISPQILDEIYDNLDEDGRDGLDFQEFKQFLINASDGLYDDVTGTRNATSALTAPTIDVHQKDAEIKALKDVNAKANTELSAANSKLVSKENEIKGLKDQLALLNKQANVTPNVKPPVPVNPPATKTGPVAKTGPGATKKK